MSDERKRIVWILGSGFSRPLGGPLLKELLSPQRGAMAAARYQEEQDRYNEPRRVFAMRQHHNLWENAEEFLDMLDHARKDPGLAKLIGGNSTLAIDDLWRFGLLAVADDCRFCDVDRTGTEAWRPYKRWAKKNNMGPVDHTITFNYDMVPESPKLRTPLPSEELLDYDVLKLHGSVDWRFQEGHFARGLGRGFDVPLIATPGPTKLQRTDSEDNGRDGLLKPLWEHATELLETADAVVFMGYRFPPSDSHALSTILEALFQNKTDVLRLHTVLGPRVNDDDTVRLGMLLRRTMRAAGRSLRGYANDRPSYSVQVHPLYAQDFMATFTELELFAPPPPPDTH